MNFLYYCCTELKNIKIDFRGNEQTFVPDIEYSGPKSEANIVH